MPEPEPSPQHATLPNTAPTITLKPLTGSSDYNLWAFRMKAYLQSKELWKASATAPEDTAAAFSIIIAYLSEDILEQVCYSGGSTAPKAWVYLEESFITSDINAKSAALTAVLNYDYDAPSMNGNLTKFLAFAPPSNNQKP